jgi:hypothetical protein
MLYIANALYSAYILMIMQYVIHLWYEHQRHIILYALEHEVLCDHPRDPQVVKTLMWEGLTIADWAALQFKCE